MKILDIISVAGLILALAAALDFAVKPAIKMRFSERVARSALIGRPYRFRGSLFSDKLLGRRLLSRRAVIAYSLLSVFSLTVSYGFAYLTTDLNLVAIFSRNPTTRDFIIFGIFIGASVCADIFSYAQTRLFLRAVDQFKNSVVSLGLVIADGLISIGLFVLFFSLARCLGYILAMYAANSPSASSSSYFMPGQIEQMVAATKLIQDHGPDGAAVWSFYGAITRAPSGTFDSRVARTAKTLDSVRSQKPKLYARIAYSASRRCINPAIDALSISSANTDSKSYFEALVRSSKLDVEDRAVALSLSNKFFDDASRDPLAIAKYSGGQCIPVIGVQRNISYSDLLAIAGPANAYFAALERTLYDAYSILAFKFAPYVPVDPQASLPDYAVSLNAVSRMTFLQIAEPDAERVRILDTVRIETNQNVKGVAIPFSPMLASSLSVTIIFLFYLLGAILVSIRQWSVSLLAGSIPSFEFDKAIFTTFGVVVVTIWISFVMALKLILWGWALLFSIL